MKYSCILFILWVFIKVNIGLENVAVVEFFPKKNVDSLNTIKENINEYRKCLQLVKTSNLNVDLMIFPEYGLTGDVENVKEYVNDIDQAQIITQLSNMAAEFSTNIVVNLLENVDNLSYFNTNLVFNKTGAIIAKYRKININPITDTKIKAGEEVVEFILEGKLFSTLTSDDILFDYPTNNFSIGVSHIVIPIKWKNRPFNTATSMLAGYAEKTKKVIYASILNEANNKTIINIKNSDGKLIAVKSTTKKFKPPKRQKNKPNFEQMSLDIKKFISKKNVRKAFNTTLELKQENKYCSIYISNNVISPACGVLSNSKVVKINEREYNVQLCAYFVCASQLDTDLQLKKFGNGVNFRQMKIRTNLNFSKSMPITLDHNLRPVSDIKWQDVDGDIVMEVNNVRQRLNMVAIVEYTPTNKEVKSVQLDIRTIIYISSLFILFATIIILLSKRLLKKKQQGGLKRHFQQDL